MKAIVQDTYGSTDVLELRDVDKPEIAGNEVLVGVHAAGVDRGVWHQMSGLPYPIRIAGYGVRTPKNRVPGTDLAGVVETVGEGVTRFQPGDEVFGFVKGTFAEYALASEDKLAPKPAGLTFEQAAAVAVSGSTALQGLRDKGRVEPGQKVLIIGASGGVGTFAVQLAKAFGAEVPGCAVRRKWTWFVLWVPTRSSTTPGRTSPPAPQATTWSSSWAGLTPRPRSRECLTHTGR